MLFKLLNIIMMRPKECKKLKYRIFPEFEERKKYSAPFWAYGWFRWRTWRCPQAGIDHLNWAKTLTNEEFLDEDEKHLAEPTRQATSAMEMLELYDWWKNVYPNRKDPMEASGWTEFCSRHRQKIKEEDPDASNSAFLDFTDYSEDEKTESRRILDLSHEIERQQEEEDEAMLIRLIKIRNSLWT